jgi:hypothetical protein
MTYQKLGGSNKSGCEANMEIANENDSLMIS